MLSRPGRRFRSTEVFRGRENMATGRLRSRNDVVMVNKVLCKLLCNNLCCVVL